MKTKAHISNQWGGAYQSISGVPSISLLTNIIFIYYTSIISTLNIENFKKKKRNEPKN
jgi:hypothetical protein